MTASGRAALRPALDLDGVNHALEGADARRAVEWAVAEFGDGLALSTSFGAHAAAMLHLVTQVKPDVPVLFIDTGYLFPETYRFADKLTKELRLNLKTYGPAMTPARQEALYGKLWEKGDAGVEEYLRTNKVEPMRRALDDLGVTAWVAGLRGAETEHRRALRRVDAQDGRIKVHPILGWSLEDTEKYITDNGLPFHPLYQDGYRSIGDWHSTLPTAPGQDPRDGRILGKKRECGIHLTLNEAESDSLKSSGL